MADRAPSPVNAETYDERVAQANALKLTGTCRSGNWTGFGGALNLVNEVINPGQMSPREWDNITGNPKYEQACLAETGSPPDWVALGRVSSTGKYIPPMVLSLKPKK